MIAEPDFKTPADYADIDADAEVTEDPRAAEIDEVYSRADAARAAGV